MECTPDTLKGRRVTSSLKLKGDNYVQPIIPYTRVYLECTSDTLKGRCVTSSLKLKGDNYVQPIIPYTSLLGMYI